MEKEKKFIHPNWDIDKTHPDKVENFRNAFRQVMDPEIGMNLIQLGLIRNVTIHEDKVSIEMILTTPYCPYAPMLMEQARSKVELMTGMETEISYGREVWNQSMMEDETSLNWGLY